MSENIGIVSKARDALFQKYANRIAVNPDLDRTLVSFQANQAIPFYSWFKYKEAFSSFLVDYLLKRLAASPGSLLDPFAGVGTAIFAASELGWATTGIETLPVGLYVMKARLITHKIDTEKFKALVGVVLSKEFAEHYRSEFAFAHIPITRGAFPPETEREMAGYLTLCESLSTDDDVRELLRFACFCVLESISYTRKDGQYLRWDHRSGRIRGRKLFDKGRIVPFRDAITEKLNHMVADLFRISRSGQMSLFQDSDNQHTRNDRMTLIKGSCLEVLPESPAESVEFILTSPPYCNRYDYTRTYALELVFLGCDEKK